MAFGHDQNGNCDTEQGAMKRHAAFPYPQHGQWVRQIISAVVKQNIAKPPTNNDA